MRIQSRKQNDTVKEERTKRIKEKFKEHNGSGMQAKKNKNKILNVLPNVHCYDTASIHYIQYYTVYVERKTRKERKKRKNLNKKFSTKRKSKKIG